MEKRELCAAPLLIFDGEGVKGVVELPRKNVVIVSDTNTMVKEITNVQGCDASKVDSSNAARHTIIQLMLQELGKKKIVMLSTPPEHKGLKTTPSGCVVLSLRLPLFTVAKN